MLRPSLLRNLAVYGASLPTMTAPQVGGGATVYIPSHLAARMLGDCQPDAVVAAPAAPATPAIPDSSHAA